MPRVSVIISAYNHAQYVERAVRSVFEQTSADWELIVIDDGSKDDTAAVLAASPLCRDPRVTLILDKTNRGQAHRFNQAVALARGEFVSLLPSDDWYLPNKLEVQLAAFLGLGPEWGVVYANGYRFYQDTGELVPVRVVDPIDGSILPRMFWDPGVIYPIVPLVRRECFVRFPFWEEFRTEGEGVYWRVGMAYKFKYVDAFVAVMREHSYNSGANIKVLHRDVPEILRRVFAHPELPPQLLPLRDAVLSQYLRKFAWNAIRQHSDRAIWQRCLVEALAVSAPRVVADPRSFLGVALAALPDEPRRRLNAALTRVRQNVYKFRLQQREATKRGRHHVATG